MIRFSAFCFCVPLLLPALHAADASVLANKTSLIAQTWPLDAVDAPIQVHGGRPKVVPGAHGKSLVLGGKTVIELKDTATLNGENGFTFSVWLNPHALDAGQQIIAAKNRYSLKERQWSLAVEEGGVLRAYLQQDKWRTITAKPLLQTGHWHHVALTVSATQAVLYLNGQPVGETPLSKPLPATQAPITLGGVRDGDRLTQQLLGAVDDARYISRVLTAAEIAKTYQPVTATQEVPKPIAPSETPLWDATAKLPKAAEAPVLDGVVFHVIQPHAPEKDGYIWLHGVGLGWHKGKLYASFGHNKGEENTPGEQARGRISSDGGRTWADTFTIGAGESDDHAVSHGVFLSHDGALWAFHGSFYGHHLTDIDSSKVHTRAYRLNETTQQWESKGTVIEGGFWPLQEPVKMTDGNWIMSGISVGHGHHAAVAISHGANFTKWDLVVIPAAEGLNMWGESTVIVDGANITNIARYGAKPQALIALSKDHGRSWSPTAPSNLPMATSKPSGGMLSTGQRYLVCTTTADSGGRRTPLTIAVSKPGSSVLSQVFIIRPSVFPQGPGDVADNASLSYPCATEHEGKLYIGYSNGGGRRGNHNSAELAVIPIQSLLVK